MQMTTTELVENFARGAKKGYASNKRLRLQEEPEWIELINYSTVIAIYHFRSNKIILNGTHYSRTTSKHQNRVRDYTPDFRLVETDETTMQRLLNGELTVSDVIEMEEDDNNEETA